MFNRKGQAMGLGGLVGVAVTLVIVGLVFAFSSQITADVQDDMTSDSLEYNITQHTLDSQEKIPAKLPTIATIIAATVIIGALVTGFAVFGKR